MDEKLDIIPAPRYDGSQESSLDLFRWFTTIFNAQIVQNDLGLRLEGYETLDAGATEFDVTRRLSDVTLTGTGNRTVTLADGSDRGQIKSIWVKSKDAGNLVIVPDNLKDADEIEVTAAPYWLDLLWSGSEWELVNQNIEAETLGGLSRTELDAQAAQRVMVGL